jgi:hypothetical protein
MALFFGKELSTLVQFLDGDVIITQFDSDDQETQTRQVVLTRRQFEEMFNHSKQLFKCED